MRPRLSQEAHQLVRGQTCVPKDRSEGSLRHLLVVRHCDAAKGGLRMPKDDMAPLLPIQDVPGLFERLDQIPAGHDR